MKKAFLGLLLSLGLLVGAAVAIQACGSSASNNVTIKGAGQ